MPKYYSTKTYGNDRGLSCCFRQWRSTHSHCSLLHGYSIGIRLVFEADTLDPRNWVMEKFISGLAIRVALINVCNLPRPNFLVVDEGFGTLDSDNLQSIFMMFDYLKTQFDFINIISHLDAMRDIVDTLVEIKKVDGFSQIHYK